MYLYNLDSKVTNKSYDILNSHIEIQKQLNTERVNEIRSKCRDILEKNGIFEDRKNGIVYQTMEKNLANLEHNIDYFNEYSFEEITKNKIDLSIENISSKIESLEKNIEFVFEEDIIKINKANAERNIKNMLFTYFESYKNSTIDLLSKSGYSQNTIDMLEEDILEYVTSKLSDILTEKIYNDRQKGINSLNSSLESLSANMINEAEARYYCQLNGQIYDELKEKRDIVRTKAQQLEAIKMQIASLELKTNELSNIKKTTSERILL